MENKIIVMHEPSPAEPFLILDKPKHLPSAPLCDGDASAYTQAESLFPELKKVVGKKTVEHGLVHRIDTETDGLLLIASTQEFYDHIQNQQSLGKFIKKYKAFCHSDFFLDDDSFPEPPFMGNPVKVPATIQSRFRYYGPKNALVRPVTDDCSKIVQKKASPVVYSTTIERFEKKDGGVDVRCSIAKGFKHQVRCHLAWCGLNVFGDDKYTRQNDECELQFSAVGLSFYLENGKFFNIEHTF